MGFPLEQVQCEFYYSSRFLFFMWVSMIPFQTPSSVAQTSIFLLPLAGGSPALFSLLTSYWLVTSLSEVMENIPQH